MTMLEMLTIPGTDETDRLVRMAMESRSRLMRTMAGIASSERGVEGLRISQTSTSTGHSAPKTSS